MPPLYIYVYVDSIKDKPKNYQNCFCINIRVINKKIIPAFGSKGRTEVFYIHANHEL